MRLGTSVWCWLLLIVLTGCEYSRESFGGLEPDAGPKLVVYGHVFPDGVDLQVTRSVPTGSVFTPADYLAPADTECLLWAGDSLVAALKEKPGTGSYSVEIDLYLEETYHITITAPGLPEARSDFLNFSPAADSVAVNLLPNSGGGNRQYGVSLTLQTRRQDYFLAVPQLEEQHEADFQRIAAITTSYDELYADECGFINEVGQLAISSTCAVDNIMSLDANYDYANFYYAEPSRAVRIDDPPARIGVRTGTISASDYRFFQSVRRNQNFFEDYLTREAIDQFNIFDGYGRIVVVNAPPPVWLDL